MKSVLRILDSSVPGDRTEWTDLWLSWPNREIQSHPGYGELFAKTGERVLAAAYSTTAGHNILYPFILRTIEDERGPLPLRDISTPYGYGGPVAWGTDLAPNDAVGYWSQFDAWAASEHVVSEFIRYGLFHTDDVPYPGEKVTRQENIVVDLQRPEEALWSSFESKVRRNVNRARREEVQITVDTTPQGFEKFHPIYVATMDRLGASADYYFSVDFFSNIHRDFPGQFAYFYAQIDGRPVSAELVLVSTDSVYFFLGGTLPEGFPKRANELLKFEVIKWAKDIGKQYFVLGGGFVPHDGLERYKRSFAPQGIRQFVTGQRIIDAPAYASLVAAKHGTSNPSTSFFPKYRAGAANLVDHEPKAQVPDHG